MSAIWPEADTLSRPFSIDIEICPACGGAVRVVACFEELGVIEKAIGHYLGEVVWFCSVLTPGRQYAI